MRLIQQTFFLWAVLASVVHGADYQVYFDSRVIAYSDSIAIKSIADDWEPPFYGGKKALAYGGAELGATWQSWGGAYFEQCDYQINFTEETAEFLYLTKNRLPLELGKEYQLAIHALHNCHEGLKLNYIWRPTSNFKTKTSLSYLRSTNFTNGSLSGFATATSEKDYDFQFDADYFYSRDVLFKRSIGTALGTGYGVDLQFDWLATEKTSMQLEVVNVAGYLHWDKAPFTTANATSDRKTYDEDGYVRYKPAITGLETYDRLTQKLPRKWFFAMQYRFNSQIELLAEHDDLKLAQFSRAGVGYAIQTDQRVEALLNVSVNALEFRYLHHDLKLEIGGDATEFNRLRYFVFQLSYLRKI